MIEPIARIMPVHDWWTGQSYSLTFFACRACGQRAALRAGVWEHKITERAECGDQPLAGLVPYFDRDSDGDEAASGRSDRPAERPQPEDHRATA